MVVMIMMVSSKTPGGVWPVVRIPPRWGQKINSLACPFPPTPGKSYQATTICEQHEPDEHFDNGGERLTILSVCL